MFAPHVIAAALALLPLSSQPVASTIQATASPAPVHHVLAQREYSLLNRYSVPSVNAVFSDNILLTLSYMDGQTKEGEKIDWEKVRQPSLYQFILKPGQSFAFHDQVLKQYENSVVQTTNAHFSSGEQFKSDDWLVGDGVCHLASFINVVSSEAGLLVDAPTNHDFAAIPDVPKQFGTAIYYVPGDSNISSKQNLYVTNTYKKDIAFVFHHTQTTLEIAIEEID